MHKYAQHGGQSLLFSHLIIKQLCEDEFAIAHMCINVFIQKMGDISEFNRRQIIHACLAGTSVSRTASICGVCTENYSI